MKKLLLIVPMVVASLFFTNCTKDSTEGGTSVEITQKQVPILFKITGETCYYCGDWGWQAWIDLADQFADGNGTGLCWANYGDGFSNQFFRKQEINPTMDPMEEMFEDGGGKPNFATNGVDYSVKYADAEAAAWATVNETATVSAGLEATITGDELTIKAAAEFYEAMDGEYYMAAYLIENNVMGPQAGPIGKSGDVEHHYVMRGSLSANAFGEQIVAAGATKGEIVEETYTVTIPDTYNRDNFDYGVVIWKKDGEKYSYVNAYSTQ